MLPDATTRSNCCGLRKKLGPLVRRLTLTIAIVVSAGHSAPGADAPWGFAWSQQRESLPRPSSVQLDGSISVLVYHGPALPSEMKDTEIVLLSVCEQAGLQQVRWVSRGLGRWAAIKKFLDIYDEGVKRQGEPDEGNLGQGTAGWSRERIGVRLNRDWRGEYRVAMISDGPQFAQCKAHPPQVGHDEH